MIGAPIEPAFHDGITTDATEVLIPIMIDGALQDRWWTYGFYPVYDDGRIRGVANPGSDDTPRLLAKRALEESGLEAERLAEARLLTATWRVRSGSCGGYL